MSSALFIVGAVLFTVVLIWTLSLMGVTSGLIGLTCLISLVLGTLAVASSVRAQDLFN